MLYFTTSLDWYIFFKYQSIKSLSIKFTEQYNKQWTIYWNETYTYNNPVSELQI